MQNNKDVLIFSLVSYVHEFLISSSGIDSTSSMNEKSLDLLFDNHFISLDPGKYLHTHNLFIYLLVLNLGYISLDSWYKLQS